MEADGFPFYTGLSTKSAHAHAHAAATYTDYKNRFAFKNSPRPNTAKTASILSKILNAVEASPNKNIYSSSRVEKDTSSSFFSVTGASSASGFVSLASYTTPTCDSNTAFVFAGLSLSQCVNDLKGSENSFLFSCTDKYITMKSFSDPSCNALVNTTILPFNFSTCYPYEEYLSSGFELTCHLDKENIPVPTGTIIDAVFDDSTCSDSSVLGYFGVTGQQCFDLSVLCDSDLADNPAFQDACAQVEEYGDSISVQFSCSSNTPSAVLYLDSKTCVQQGIFPPIAQPLDPDCSPVLEDTTKGTLFMCKKADDDDDDASTLTSSSPTNNVASTGAIVGGVVGGVAAAGVIGYVAYTKVFAKGASILSNKAMASQAHVSSDL